MTLLELIQKVAEAAPAQVPALDSGLTLRNAIKRVRGNKVVPWSAGRKVLNPFADKKAFFDASSFGSNSLGAGLSASADAIQRRTALAGQAAAQKRQDSRGALDRYANMSFLPRFGWALGPASLPVANPLVWGGAELAGHILGGNQEGAPGLFETALDTGRALGEIPYYYGKSMFNNLRTSLGSVPGSSVAARPNYQQWFKSKMRGGYAG